MHLKFLMAPFLALAFLVQPSRASVVQLPLNGRVLLESHGGALTVGIDDIQISGFPTFDLSDQGQFTFAYATILANFIILDGTGSSVDSGSLALESDNCPFCLHPPVPSQLTFTLPAGQFELDITSSSQGHSNSGSTVVVSYGIFASSNTVAAIPEPTTWAMMLLGFLGLAIVSNRRRRMKLLDRRW